jgi:hypothetical protein
MPSEGAHRDVLPPTTRHADLRHSSARAHVQKDKCCANPLLWFGGCRIRNCNHTTIRPSCKKIPLGMTSVHFSGEAGRQMPNDVRSRWRRTSVADHLRLHLLRPRLGRRPSPILPRMHSSLSRLLQRPPMRHPPPLPPRPVDVHRRMQVPMHAVHH